MSDTKHTVTLDNRHVIRKSDLAFNKIQPSAPIKFSVVPNSLNNSHDLAGKRKRNSPLKRPDSNEGGPSTSYKRAPLSNPYTQGGKWFKKTVNRREGEPYFTTLGGKPLSDTKHTVTLENGHLLRKTVLAFKKINLRLPVNFQQFRTR